MNKPRFVYVTYIDTTPKKLWEALTDPAFIRQYFDGHGPRSDWEEGSRVDWYSSAADDFVDMDQVVLESDPPRKLSYTWHNYQEEHKEMFGWSDEKLEELRREQRSKVTFEIEPAGSAVKLTVTHDGFEGHTEMLKGVSQGWPMILSNLKTLLETGDPLSMQPA